MKKIGNTFLLYFRKTGLWIFRFSLFPGIGWFMKILCVTFFSRELLSLIISGILCVDLCVRIFQNVLKCGKSAKI